jgi:hypothetical protein
MSDKALADLQYVRDPVAGSQYALIQKLGEGGFGSVHLAEKDGLVGERYAVKISAANADAFHSVKVRHDFLLSVCYTLVSHTRCSTERGRGPARGVRLPARGPAGGLLRRHELPLQSLPGHGTGMLGRPQEAHCTCHAVRRAHAAAMGAADA